MSYLQLARSRRITIQFGEIMRYMDTVSIGSRYVSPFSHPFPVLFHPFPSFSRLFSSFSRPFPYHVPPQNLSCPQPQGGKAANTFSCGKMSYSKQYKVCIFSGDAVGRRQIAKCGKAALTGIQDRGANVVRAVVIEAADREALKAFDVEKRTEAASVFGDDAAATQGLPRRGFSVKQAVGEIGRDHA